MNAGGSSAPHDRELIERSRRLIREAEYMTLATVCESGAPWSSVLHHVWFDDPPRMVYASVRDALHSRNVERDPRVAGSLFVSGALEDEPFASVDGAQFTGHCEQVQPDELAWYHDAFFRKILPDEVARAEWMLPLDSFRGPAAHRLYLISLSQWWIVDFSTWAQDRVDRRVEVGLEAISPEVS